MKVIHKYPFDTFPNVTLNIPAGADILKVAWQGTRPCVWVIADTERTPERRRFLILPTGAQVQNQKDLRFLDTVFVASEVYHVFEVVPVEDL